MIRDQRLGSRAWRSGFKGSGCGVFGFGVEAFDALRPFRGYLQGFKHCTVRLWCKTGSSLSTSKHDCTKPHKFSEMFVLHLLGPPGPPSRV